MAVTHHIGLEIAQNAFKLVEIRTLDGFPAILRADLYETTRNYGSSLLHEIPFDYDLAKSFIHELTDLLQRRMVYSGAVSISLPALVPVIATIPVDAGLTVDEKREHFLWECRTLNALDPDLDLHVMPLLLDSRDGVETHLLVSLPKATLQFLKSTFLHLTFSVHSIDIDHFILERAVRKMHPQATEAAIAVFGIFEEYCLLGVYHESAYRGFRSTAVSYKENYVKQVLRLLESVLAGEESLQIDQIFLYGQCATKSFQDTLRSVVRVPVTVFNPFSRFSFLTESDASAAVKHPKHTFDVAVCAAWKDE